MDDRPRGSQCPELEGHDCENDQLPDDPELVWNLLLQLDPYKSIGPDGINVRILKELTDVIAKPISMIFQRSWESGEVPADWTLANVLSIFKKGKKEDHGNYRPVSLTSEPIKIMEKIILVGIEKHVEDNAAICHSQQVFMRGKPCLLDLISFYIRVTHVTDLGKPLDVIFFNISKSFDTVSHSILLDKMSSTQLNNCVMQVEHKELQ
ncbi:RNA-directed DNA polymerase from mobile element jockey-like protein [Pitangus sulphuratus]|nr:RNA-directed DNA polymerase from mobile element jockey-like protein [Pitangus sulphuratus]